MAEHLPNAFFSFIRYAAVWEDADVLLQGLQLAPGADVLCICSAGDNALSLLATSPARVTAIDLSAAQLHLAALKKAAFAVLDHPSLLLFLADSAPENRATRTVLYRKVRAALLPGDAAFWDTRKAAIAAGVLDGGKFERYFAAFRRYFLPLTHSRAEVQELLRPKSGKAQETYYRERWNNWRWRLLMSLFFSRAVLGRWGRDPAFLEHVHIPVSEFIRQQAARHLQSEKATRNPFLHRIFTGRYGNTLPHFLRPEHFDAIRQNLDKLHFEVADAGSAMRARPYDAYALSNIFEYLSPPDVAAFAADVTPHIPAGARLAFWNLMAPRSFAEIQPAAFACDEAACEKLSEEDNGFFYSRFRLETRL